MSQNVSIELSEEAYDALRQQAEAVGTSPARLAAASLERQFAASGSQRTQAEQQAARDRFERHFGEIDLGCRMGADNENIDADLAKHYADTHEDG